MRKLILASILFAATASHAYNVHCWGRNTRTGATVDGYCNNGSFSGRDWSTGEWVTGSCREGGSLNAYTQTTRDWVTGQCDRDPFPIESEGQLDER
jgi:hypothetical protein